MKKLLRIDAENKGKFKTFELPVGEDEAGELEGFRTAAFPTSEDRWRSPIRTIADDPDLTRIAEFPASLVELNAFLLAWSGLTERRERQTLVALLDHSYDWESAIEKIELGLASVSPVLAGADEEEDDEELGRHYLEKVLAEKFKGRKIPEFLKTYFDCQAFGRDVRMHGADGFWSDVYNCWVYLDYPNASKVWEL